MSISRSETQTRYVIYLTHIRACTRHIPTNLDTFADASTCEEAYSLSVSKLQQMIDEARAVL